MQNNKILGLSELKPFVQTKKKDYRMVISVADRVENIGGKGENVVTSIFSFSHNVFYHVMELGAISTKVEDVFAFFNLRGCKSASRKEMILIITKMENLESFNSVPNDKF